jgi:hypothetical protein
MADLVGMVGLWSEVAGNWGIFPRGRRRWRRRCRAEKNLLRPMKRAGVARKAQ